MFCCVRKQEESPGLKRVKMVIVGDGDCGKTCLLHRFAYNQFFPHYSPTVFDVETKTVYYREQEVELVMYDTAGQEDYDRLRPLSYADTDVAVVCFSLDCQDSLDNVLLNWLPEVRYFCGAIPVLLVGNKMDLRKPSSSAHDTQILHTPPTTTAETTTAEGPEMGQEPEPEDGWLPLGGKTISSSSSSTTKDPKDLVSFGEGQEVALKMSAVGYFETSAKTGEGTDAVFEGVVRAGMEIKRKKGGRGCFGKKRS